MAIVEIIGKNRVKKWFRFSAETIAKMIWASCLGAILLIATPPALALIGMEPNPIFQDRAILIAVANFVGATVLTLMLRKLASATCPELDSLPPLGRAYIVLRPPFWAKWIVWLAVYMATKLQERKALQAG
jgi:hypothetical protein